MRNASGHQCQVKLSGSEKKKKVNENTHDISFIKRVTRKFHVLVVQNNGKEMYKKSVLHVQSCLIANKTYCCFFTVLWRCLRCLALQTGVLFAGACATAEQAISMEAHHLPSSKWRVSKLS